MKIGTCPFLKEGCFLDFQCSSFKWPLPTMRSLIRNLRVNRFCSFPDNFNSSSNVLCFSVFPVGPGSLWQFRSPQLPFNSSVLTASCTIYVAFLYKTSFGYSISFFSHKDKSYLFEYMSSLLYQKDESTGRKGLTVLNKQDPLNERQQIFQRGQDYK